MRPARPACGATERADPGIPSAVPSAVADLVHVRARAGQPAAGRAARRGRRREGPPRRAGPSGSPRLARDPEDVTDASDSPPTREAIEWRLPPHDLLDPGEVPTAATTDNADVVHARNEEIIVKKLASFDIEARIIGRNAGPVVTQYEVQPAPHIKLSRIEALQDDLSMALAARSIRIEAPIPGKSAVGIEIPNKEFNIVALRRILEEVDFIGVRARADVRAGPGRRRPRPGRGPGQDAPPADRGRHGLGQERHGQRAHHQPAVQRHAGRRRG